METHQISFFDKEYLWCCFTPVIPLVPDVIQPRAGENCTMYKHSFSEFLKRFWQPSKPCPKLFVVTFTLQSNTCFIPLANKHEASCFKLEVWHCFKDLLTLSPARVSTRTTNICQPIATMSSLMARLKVTVIDAIFWNRFQFDEVSVIHKAPP